MDTPCYSIRLVAERTGLSPHVIRIWEKRYGAVQPRRTSSNRRQYTERELERLLLLARAVAAGHAIGCIARLPEDRLRDLVRCAGQAEGNRFVSTGGLSCGFVEEAIGRVTEFDEPGLRRVLNRALVAVGHRGFLCRIASALIEEVGQKWRNGELMAAHEHFLSGVLRVFLGRMEGHATGMAPRLVVATPAGQIHELGALLAGAAAGQMGWRPIQLGSNLPAAEIAGAVLRTGARAAALSIVYPEDDPQLPEELRRLREFLPGQTAILVGGRGAPSYRRVLEEIGAILFRDLAGYCDVLDRLRREGLS
ncbi:MAG: MerR family transcriptional regulator [Verrucomicrobiota bacterium]|nr:MerR family transcriptional regulator [Limisphaera sp.]MDW8381806.1 MerR family transcriptional regulator [Verrucomicrobiota bacterium]